MVQAELDDFIRVVPTTDVMRRYDRNAHPQLDWWAAKAFEPKGIAEATKRNNRSRSPPVSKGSPQQPLPIKDKADKGESRKIYVRGLSYEASDSDVRDYFGHAGALAHSWVPKGEDLGRQSKGFRKGFGAGLATTENAGGQLGILYFNLRTKRASGKQVSAKGIPGYADFFR